MVFAVALQSNHQVLIGGQFTQVNGATHYGIARLNVNGALDTAYYASATGTGVTSIAIQSDGKAVIGGAFTHVNSTARANIARLNANGTLDTDFDPGTGVTGTGAYLDVVRLQSDGKVLIGGVFTDYNGTARTNMARLNADGSLDTTFDPGTNGEVLAIALQPDGKILIGGDFTTVRGETRNRIARLNANGSSDSTFTPNVDQSVNAILVQPDGKIVIGGQFTTINSTARNRIARLNADGSLDTTFDPGTGAAGGGTPFVSGIARQMNGKVLIGGRFATVNGTGRGNIARLNADGSLDATFDPGAGTAGGTSAVYAMELQSDGKVLIGGGFQTVDGVSRNRIARLWGDNFLFLPLILR